MQIYGASQLHGAQPIAAPHALRSTSPAQVATTSFDTTDVVQFSSEAQLASRLSEIPDIRMDRVESIRAALAEGVYETDAKLSMALDRLLDEIA